MNTHELQEKHRKIERYDGMPGKRCRIWNIQFPGYSAGLEKCQITT